MYLKSKIMNTKHGQERLSINENMKLCKASFSGLFLFFFYVSK